MALKKISRLAFHTLIGIAALPIVQSSAQAIVINDTAGIETARRLGAPFTSVTDLFFNGRSFCSGSLINASYVLTAQHCVFGDDPSDLSVGFRDSDPLNTLIADIPVSNIFNVESFNSLLDGKDVSILELSAPAPDSIKPLRLITDTDQLVGSTITTVGFGLNGVGSEGHEFTGDDLRWAADNVLDWVGGAALPAGFELSEENGFANSLIHARDRDASLTGEIIPETTNIFSTDFDDGTAINNTMSEFGSSARPLKYEGTTAPGDSGSPLLVKHNDEYLIAAVLSGGTTFNSVFGDISWWTGTENHREFIEKRGGQFVDVPEPSSSLVLITLGAVGAGVMRNRKRRGADHA